MRKMLLLCLCSLALFACSEEAGGSSVSVSMAEGQRFDPEELTIVAGETVTWRNDSAEAHTVTAYTNKVPEGAYFASGDAASEEIARAALEKSLLTQGETYEFTFEEPGTYRYYCIPHEGQGMVGTIVVEG